MLEGSTTVYLGDFKVLLTRPLGSDDGTHLAGWTRADGVDVTISNWTATKAGDTMSGSFTLAFHPDDSTAGTVIVKAAMQDMKEQKASTAGAAPAEKNK
jgi:hypothetical protein